MVEVKLDSMINALAIRKAFAEKRKNRKLPQSVESLFVTNCVNLATRVRIDVLRAIAKKVTNDKDIAYVSGFISRPMMHIKSPTAGRPLKSFTYIDAISRFHNILTKEDLLTAYEGAGRAFSGQLEQNFVVLNKADQIQMLGYDPAGPWSKGRGGGNQRGRRGGASGPSGPSGRSGLSGSSGSSGPSGPNARGKGENRGSGFGGKGQKRSGSNLESSATKRQME
jgi:hypothetical protein